MLFLLYVGTVLYGIFVKDRKNFWLWCALLLIIITNTSVGYADYDNYENYFMRVVSGEMNISYMGMPLGWYYLCVIFGKLGIAFRGMNAIVLLASFYLTHKFVKRFDCKQSLFWSFFIIFPGLIQCVQNRFFLGTSIVLFFMISMIHKEKHGIIKFLIGIVLASLIHTSCVIFIIFIFIPMFDFLPTWKSILISVFGIISIFFSLSFISKIAVAIVPSQKYERYFDSSISQSTLSWILKIFIIWIVGVVFCNLCIKMTNKISAELGNEDTLNRAIISKMNFIVCFLGITIPFLVFDSNFHRFIELGFVMIYILFSRCWKYSKINIRNKMLLMLILMVIIVFSTYVYTPFETVIKPFFTFSNFHSLFL